MASDHAVMSAAIHNLHEQAHGRIPFRTCAQEPCRSLSSPTPGSLWLRLDGPAPAVMPLLGDDQ